MKTLNDVVGELSNWEMAEFNDLLDAYLQYAELRAFEDDDNLTDFEDI